MSLTHEVFLVLLFAQNRDRGTASFTSPSAPKIGRPLCCVGLDDSPLWWGLSFALRRPEVAV